MWIAEAALSRGEPVTAAAVLARAMALPVYADLPAADRAEARAWALVTATTRGARPPPDYAAQRAVLVAQFGSAHSRVRALERAARRATR